MTSTLSVSASSNPHIRNIYPDLPHQSFSDPNRLAPKDAYFAQSPGIYARPSGNPNHLVRRDNGRGRSRSRRRKGGWKKLLWVKQDYPDNYTDPPTFLSHLQRNPRLLPYDFWPLVADSTVIVQHICSVAIFVCCFVGIIQDRVSPVAVVSWGSAGTVLGWMLWDFWLGQEEATQIPTEVLTTPHRQENFRPAAATSALEQPFSHSNSQSKSRSQEPQHPSLGLALTTSNLSSHHGHSHSSSQASVPSPSSALSPTLSINNFLSDLASDRSIQASQDLPASLISPRNQQRLTTAKSAILIYCALLGLSPILKSLTKSTTSDSIWALSCWLMCINILFFDYGGGVGVKFPASLSTNAALMASTVLASRLPSTTHVFSLTLFSIEVFGLFPVFRRHLRHISWRGHLLLTLFLVLSSGLGMSLILVGGGGGRSGSRSETGNSESNRAWGRVIAGVFLWSTGTAVGMGGCSWWLISLQKYKNVVIGPWDAARPVIRQAGGWE